MKCQKSILGVIQSKIEQIKLNFKLLINDRIIDSLFGHKNPIFNLHKKIRMNSVSWKRFNLHAYYIY